MFTVATHRLYDCMSLKAFCESLQHSPLLHSRVFNVFNPPPEPSSLQQPSYTWSLHMITTYNLRTYAYYTSLLHLHSSCTATISISNKYHVLIAPHRIPGVHSKNRVILSRSYICFLLLPRTVSS